MKPKKLFIFLADGVGLRNFAFTQFYAMGKARGYEVVFWNASSFDLSALGYAEIKIPNAKNHRLTDLVKTAQIQLELSLNKQRSKDSVYDSYRFPSTPKTLSAWIKKILLSVLIFTHQSEKGLLRIQRLLAYLEKQTPYYSYCRDLLQEEKPDLLFCTNQRLSQALAPVMAAQSIQVPTATFIFSWDNLPKGTKLLQTDFYLVWSQHMKYELQFYYPKITDSQIKITGTPQFEAHYDVTLLQSREDFFAENGLDLPKKYLCFSGDDITTSPNDPIYLSDMARAVRSMNEAGNSLGILFRRCPVDFSTRYDAVLQEFQDCIVSVAPKWKKKGADWNTILPTKADMQLLVNTIYHTQLVVNLGSSMVFDYAALGKPCAYIRYDVPNCPVPDWSVQKIYNFIHFRSMPTKLAVYWLDSPDHMKQVLSQMLSNQQNQVVEQAQIWFEKINQTPANKAADRIWNAFDELIK
jgi:hypothetical protein